MDQSLLIYLVAGLAFVAIAGIGFAFAGPENTSSKRVKQYQNRDKVDSRARQKGTEAARRKQNQQMLDKLREDNKEKKSSLIPRDIKSRLMQAGLDVPVSAFWIVSVLLGVGAGIGTFMSGADGFTYNDMEIRSRPLVIAMGVFAGGVGLPRWTLGFLISSRAGKMTNQFADGIDIIVRGVKSGLPLNECLRIIGKESPEPLASEFRSLSSNIQMGNTLEQALNKFYKRLPLPEVNFFVIVLLIQAKAGGNLSEALANLSGIIRSRKMMREKIKALSSEAKASAMIIGSLPFAVGTMVYMSTPDYIMELFTTSTGHFILGVGTVLMVLGITVMRNMINFDI
ncbi:MAG: type II secretion system F family protein [Pseudomonadota bacterium]